jgi:Virulence factor
VAGGVASIARHVENRHRLSGIDDYQQGRTHQGNHWIMAEVTVVYWRDIPAQVIVGKGRRGSKVQLTERFEQAIDRCAMKIGAKPTSTANLTASPPTMPPSLKPNSTLPASRP